ncbi:transposase [Pseudarthrobacter sp. HLT3-5]|nr:transposase [Pseudarthrobacter sp. HLT3-5]
MHSRILAEADAAGMTDWEVSSTPRSTGPTSTPRTFPATQGDLSNYMNLLEEPPDHGIGRSRGGLTTRIHHLCDGKMRPLVMLLGPGQGGDSPMFPHLLDSLSAPRLGPGWDRSRPDPALADKAYSSKANRELLRRCGIQAVIPERSVQEANRKRRSRPVGLDKEAYKRRNVAERSFNIFKQMAWPRHRDDKPALTYRGGVVLRAITICLKELGDMP